MESLWHFFGLKGRMNVSFSALSLRSQLSTSPLFSGNMYKDITKSHFTNFFSPFSFNSFQRITKSSFNKFLSSPIRYDSSCATFEKITNPDVTSTADCIKIVECTFDRCTTTDKNGGACSFVSKKVTINATSFIKCSSSLNGGAIFASSNTELAIDRSCSYLCSSKIGGAFLASEGEATITDCAFDSNRPLDTTEQGTAMQLKGRKYRLDMCNITHNVGSQCSTITTDATVDFTAKRLTILQNAGASIISISGAGKSSIKDINFVENTVFGATGGLINAKKDVVIENSVFRDNTGELVSSSSTNKVTMKNCSFDQQYEPQAEKLDLVATKVYSYPSTYQYSPSITAWCHGASYEPPKEMKNSQALLIFCYCFASITLVCGIIYMVIPIIKNCKDVEKALN